MPVFGLPWHGFYKDASATGGADGKVWVRPDTANATPGLVTVLPAVSAPTWCSVADHDSCKAALLAGCTADGAYTVQGVKTYCDQTADGGGWALMSNTRTPSSQCSSAASGSFTSLGQAANFKLSDAAITAIQGTGASMFRYTETGYTGCTGTNSGSSCTGKVYWRAAAGKTFGSSKGSASSIHTCSDTYGGTYHVGNGYSNHYGLDTYMAGGAHNGKCGIYFIYCYGSGFYKDASATGGADGKVWIYFKSGPAYGKNYGTWDGYTAWVKAGQLECPAITASPTYVVNFAGPLNKYTGSGGAYCPSNGDNQVAYMDSLITSRDFEVTFSPNQITCGAGIVLGFAFASSAGEGWSDNTSMDGKDPEMRSGFSRPRVAISTICDPAGKMQFWEYSAGRQGGRGSVCQGNQECQESIEGASAGDVIGLKRVSSSGKCILSITKNGKIIKTANSHEFEGDGCGSGYVWMGNYNSAVKQCVSKLQVVVSPTAEPFCERKGYAFSGGDMGSWSSLSAAEAGCSADSACQGFYKPANEEIYFKSGPAYGKNYGTWDGYTAWVKAGQLECPAI
eukprot:g6086.t1